MKTLWCSATYWKRKERPLITNLLNSFCCCCFYYFFFYCSGFCHTLKWISHGFACVPYPDAPSHLPLHPIPLGLPSAPWLAVLLCTGKYHFTFLFSSQASYTQSPSSRNCGPFTNPICPLTSFLGGDGGGLFAKSCPTLVIPWTVACQAPLSRRFSRQESWNAFPCLFPQDLSWPRDRARISYFSCINRQVLYH